MTATPHTFQFDPDDFSKPEWTEEVVPFYTPTPPVFSIYTAEQMGLLKPPEYLLKSTITKGGLTVLHGDSQAGKSLHALQWALTLARGDKTDVDWCGQERVGGPYNVLYMAGEGQTGLYQRMEGWRNILAPGMKQLPDNLWFEPEAVSINPADTNGALALLNVVEHLKLDVVFVDTLFRFFKGDENSAEDMATLLDTTEKLKNQGVAVVLVHHNRRSDNQIRGSGSLYNGADFVCSAEAKTEGSVYISGTLDMTKTKDGPAWKGKKNFKREVYYPYPDYDVPVLVPVDNPKDIVMDSVYEDRILSYLKDNGPTLISALEKEVDGKNSSISAAARRLIDQEILGGGEYGKPVYVVTGDAVEGL